MSRAIDLLGVVSPTSATVAKVDAADLPVGYVAAPAVALGLTGFALWKQHPVLGFFAGECVGANAYRLYRGEGDDRVLAYCGLGQQAAAVVGSLAWKQHPFYGYLLGFVIGSAVTALVPGSNAHKFVRGQ